MVVEGQEKVEEIIYQRFEISGKISKCQNVKETKLHNAEVSRFEDPKIDLWKRRK